MLLLMQLQIMLLTVQTDSAHATAAINAVTAPHVAVGADTAANAAADTAAVVAAADALHDSAGDVSASDDDAFDVGTLQHCCRCGCCWRY